MTERNLGTNELVNVVSEWSFGYISFVRKFLSEIQKCTKSEAFLSEQIISEPVKRRMDFERKSNSYLILSN